MIAMLAEDRFTIVSSVAVALVLVDCALVVVVAHLTSSNKEDSP